MNVYTPSRFDERVFHLALGVEPTSAISGQRLAGPVDARWERFPRPVDRWRRWPPGVTLTRSLPRLDRHRSGRFALRYDQDVTTTMDVRIVDDGRRIVSRRVRLTIADEQTVLDAEAGAALAPHPAWRRIFPLACFPGAAADLPSGASVLRGRVVRAVAPNVLVPVRWPRVRAMTTDGSEVGWAHGDDRGEFVLVVGSSAADVTVPVDPLPVVLTIGAQLPPPVPDPLDPLLAVVDDLWDLPLEPVVASPTPATEDTINGRRFLIEHTELAPIPPGPIDVPHGRETSVVVRIA